MRSFRNWTATLCSFWSQRTSANSWDTTADGERSSFWARITEFKAICKLWDCRAASDIRVRHRFSMSIRPEMNGVKAVPICCLCSLCLTERRREMRAATIFSRAGKLEDYLERGTCTGHRSTYSKFPSISPNFGNNAGSSIPLFKHSCRSSLSEFA
jgi:hypothetical protein